MNRTPIAALFTLFVASSSTVAQLHPREGSAPIAARSHVVEALVEDGFERTSVRQTFVSPYDRTIEAVFVCAMPQDAALVDVAMVVGGERIEGLLAERKHARGVYDDVVRRRRDPALVERVGREALRLSVFPVVPAEETVVELTWVRHLPRVGGAHRFVYPVPAGEQAFSLDLTLRSSVPIVEVAASRDDVELVRVSPREARAAFECSEAPEGGELVVVAETRSERPELAVRTFRGDDGDGWFVAVVTPPELDDAVLPRDVILVVDTSGSMKDGGKLEQAQSSALWLLENLRPIDRVNVLRFSSTAVPFADGPVEASAENLAALAKFVRGFEATGSTALGDALATALRVEPAPGRVRSVVLLTDGRPTVGEKEPAKLIALAGGGAGRGLRLFPFGVGTDVDAALLHGMAAAGHGQAEVFRPGGEVETRLTSFLVRSLTPVVADLELEVEGVPTYDVFPRPLPDLYRGEQLTIAGRYRGGGEAKVRLAARVAGGGGFEATAAFRAEPGGARLARPLFAQKKLAWLEQAHRLRLGLADDAYYAALDRGAYSTADEIVGEMIAVSLEHGVQSAFTSFIVLEGNDRARILAEGAPEAEPGFMSDSPFDSDAFNDVIGIGGGAGGKFGGRRGGRKSLRAAGKDVEAALSSRSSWLAREQAADGSWNEDVLATGLAVLAFLGEGNTTVEGARRDNVARGVRWLRDQQWEDGRIGKGGPVESHAVATLAVAEAYHGSKSPLLRSAVERALAALVDAEPASADPALVGWRFLALLAARDAGVKVKARWLEAELARLEAAAAPAGCPAGEAMAAAVRVLCRVLAANAIGVADEEAMEELVAELEADGARVLGKPMTRGAGGCDEYSLFATYAMFQMGGAHWREWERALREVMVGVDGADGGWEPLGECATGRDPVATAAMVALMAEVYFRYARIRMAR